MHTLRLRRIQQPSIVERLLEAYVSRMIILPDGSYHVSDPQALPPGVRTVVARAAGQGQVWLCWARCSEIWLFTCEMSLPLSRERGTPVLLVRRYGEDAQLKDSGAWRYDALDAWSRCAD
jgi:hypothetical protein